MMRNNAESELDSDSPNDVRRWKVVLDVTGSLFDQDATLLPPKFLLRHPILSERVPSWANLAGYGWLQLRRQYKNLTIEQQLEKFEEMVTRRKSGKKLDNYTELEASLIWLARAWGCGRKSEGLEKGATESAEQSRRELLSGMEAIVRRTFKCVK